MQDSFKHISRVWLDFPKDLENLHLYNDVIKFKNLFEENESYFNDFLTKIIIFGDVSVGKSTIINSLIGKEYFQTKPAHGTISLFYCSQTEKDYEYFTINDDAEVKEVDLLMNTLGIRDALPDNIDKSSIIKVYIKNNVTELLQKKTALIDCPGFGQDEVTDRYINDHCLNADKIIFVFDHRIPPSPKQRNDIKIFKFKKSSCLFVYNKCEEILCDNEKVIRLTKEFYKVFKEQYHESSKSNDANLYFISAKSPEMGTDFKRLKENILTESNNNYFRFLKVKAMLFQEIKTFKKSLKNCVLSKKTEKMNLSKILATIDKDSNVLNKECSNLLNYVRNLIKECSKDLKAEKIFDDIFVKVNNYKGKCTKHDAYLFILKLAESIDKGICEYLIDLLNKTCVSIINNKIENIKKGINNEIIMIESIKLTNEENTFVKTDMKLNIFWPHERGSKAEKVKAAYIKYLQKENIRVEIIEKISKIYNDHLSKVKINLHESIKCSRTKVKENLDQLRKNCKNEDIRINLLEDYEKKILNFIESYGRILVKYIK